MANNSIFIGELGGSQTSGNVAFPVGSSATIEIDGIATTSTTGLTLQNITPATAGVTVQRSPRFILAGTGYNSVSTLSEVDSWFAEARPSTAAGSTAASLNFGNNFNAGSFTDRVSFSSGGSISCLNLAPTGTISTYNGIATSGWGVPAIQASGRVTGQNAANASIATYTVGAADGSFEVSANMNVTASTVLTTTLTCTYTDEANVARSMILPVASLAGTFITAGAITGAGASVWETATMHIRCKASTAITILTSTGTFTGVTYTAGGTIKQIA